MQPLAATVWPYPAQPINWTINILGPGVTQFQRHLSLALNHIGMTLPRRPQPPLGMNPHEPASTWNEPTRPGIHPPRHHPSVTPRRVPSRVGCHSALASLPPALTLPSRCHPAPASPHPCIAPIQQHPPPHHPPGVTPARSYPARSSPCPHVKKTPLPPCPVLTPTKH